MILFSRAPLAPPGFEALPGRCAAALRRASNGLARLRPLSPRAIAAAPPARFAALSHALSADFERLNAAPAGATRSGLECEALRLAAAAPEGIDLSTPAAFRASLERINALATDGAGRWRTDWAGLMPDLEGHRINFPPASAILGQLEAVRTMMRDREAPALFNAVAVLCLFVNGHPFTDGNGRCARILFNALLRARGMADDVYFPFYELAARSRGGYVIALRCAELRGDWRPIMNWAVEAIRCHRTLGGGG